MKKKVLVGVVGCTMLLSLSGCFPLGYKLVKEDNTEAATQQTTQVDVQVRDTEEVTEATTEEQSSQSSNGDFDFDFDEESTTETEVSTESSSTDVSDTPKIDISNYDYVSTYGYCFDCNGSMKNLVDEPDYCSYSYDGDLFFDVTMKQSDAFTLDEEIEFIKEVPPGEVIEEKRDVSIYGYDSFYGAYKADGYYVAKSFISAYGRVFSMECVFDSEEGLELAKQALSSFSYYNE